MKIRLFAALVIALLMIPMMTGCSLWALESRLEAAEETIDTALDNAEDAAQTVFLDAVTPGTVAPPAAAKLTGEEAEAIALAHAGLTADQVVYLRTELDDDRGQPEYEVEFRVDRWEYDYEINADTGEILSWDKDWDD